MRLLVCIKQVPNTDKVRLDPVKGTMLREGVDSIINPDDKHAIEEALLIREKEGGEITVLTMGPTQASYALYEALSMGVDHAVLLTDRAFAGSDTWATSFILSKAIRHLGEFDLILCGRQAIDGDTAQVGPQLAEQLDMPQITYVTKIQAINNDFIIAQRQLDGYLETVQASVPALLTVIRSINVPRYPTVSGIMEAFDKTIRILTSEMIGCDPNFSGLKYSPTQVKQTFTPPLKGPGKRLEGTPESIVKQLTLSLLGDQIL